MLEYAKLPMGCLLILLYITYQYYSGNRKREKRYRFTWFEYMLWTAVIGLVTDIATVNMVNHLDEVSPVLNMVVHGIFLMTIDMFIYSVFIYVLITTEGLPKKSLHRWLLFAPALMTAVIVFATLPRLYYVEHEISNYSMGIPAYTCYLMAAIYIIATVIAFYKKWNYLEKNKRANIALYLGILIVTTLYQMLAPHALVTSIGITLMMIGLYVNQENPAVKELNESQREVVTGFSVLVEERDNETGGHIQRTSMYAELLAKELRKKGLYTDILTKDYINSIKLAAPLHDVGKICIPDAILQKPGKLTDEEFEIMKKHSEEGGRIIKGTFGNLHSLQYKEIAYEMATYHHERWDGKGYPKGLTKHNIPLCARIMSIADVFDAVSEKRCYRDAMPIDECFEIIKNGREKNFDPVMVDTFLSIRSQVEDIHNHIWC